MNENTQFGIGEVGLHDSLLSTNGVYYSLRRIKVEK